jgi:hypothetical protein
MQMKALAALAILAAGLAGIAVAQDTPPAGAPPQNGQRMGRGTGGDFQGVGGQIMAIDGNTVTLQTFRGDTAKVKVTGSTIIRKEGAAAKLTDFKVGDRIMVAGEQGKDGVWVAQMLGQRRGGEGSPRAGGMGGQRPAPEDNGKTYIFGTVTKIDGARLTVKKPDGAEQMVEVDDDTSFRNERRESITLADVKVGDIVRGQGAAKDGVFVPRQLTKGTVRPRQLPLSGAQPGVQTQSPAAPQSQSPQSEVVPDSSK